MRWRRGRKSSNVEDRRGRRAAGGGVRIGGGLGLLVVLAVVLLGGDPLQFLGALVDDGGGGAGPAPEQGTAPATADDELADFTARVLGMTEDTWGEIFSETGRRYRPPVLVMFTDATRSACGFGSSATGPFYCPPDERIYIDLGFFGDLARMAGVASDEFDFAGAYVIAHEVGHHVQNLLGTSDQVRQAQARSPGDANRLSVLLELQADCFAGVWASRARTLEGRGVLEPGDVQEGMRAAAAIGDDRLARSAGRTVSPESFTHGTSEQRRHWLQTGLESGDPEACDTFAQAGYR
ncbi:MAG: neutral zinc metallopeptidase [Gemmatimonadota bacterium]